MQKNALPLSERVKSAKIEMQLLQDLKILASVSTRFLGVLTISLARPPISSLSTTSKYRNVRTSSRPSSASKLLLLLKSRSIAVPLCSRKIESLLGERCWRLGSLAKQGFDSPRLHCPIYWHVRRHPT